VSEPESKYTGEWELVETQTGAAIQQFRQRVPGGWLVLCASGGSTTMVHLPDPTGEWNPPLKQSRKKGFDVGTR
jgi:hypothetical protein